MWAIHLKMLTAHGLKVLNLLMSSAMCRNCPNKPDLTTPYSTGPHSW